uniref:(California timema) hypothetical protein n=1 Tax=Timema californicum TaxID=61474 RepID=A0A7R9JJ49_TIMCA|nr:unnamed protein product [Timema californicum]
MRNWLICEDPGCTNRIRRVPLHFSRNYPICTQCEKGVMFKEPYQSFLNNISEFRILESLPVKLNFIEDMNADKLVQNSGAWHKSFVKFSNLKLERDEIL